MACFAVPFRPRSATISQLKPSRKPKRKRDNSSSSSSASTATSSSDSESDDNIHTTLNVLTNPLSLTQADIAQYKLAGLELNEKLPNIPEWPHRGSFPFQSTLPIRGKRANEGKELSGDGEKHSKINKGAHKPSSKSFSSQHHVTEVVGKKNQRVSINGHQLRLHHIHVLTTILHKCLLAHDIRRASRAWGLLIRMQTSEHGGMDLRSNGYWSIGAELLIRSLSSKHSDNTTTNITTTINSNIETAEDCERSYNNKDESHLSQTSKSWWDLTRNLQRVTDYYERLIVEYPFKKQFLSKISALDWWPVMIGCEIYGIQYEQKKALRNLEKKTTLDEESLDDTSSDEYEREDGIDYGENTFDNKIDPKYEKLAQRKRLRKQEHRWRVENEIRLAALNASEKVAMRLDERMTIPPYSESLDLLHLRGMLALYIGDLYVSPLPPKSQFEESVELVNDNQTISRRESPYFQDMNSVSQGCLILRERRIDFEKGLVKRSNEIKNAKKIFDKLAKLGGDVLPLDLEVEDDESLLSDLSEN
ncbi:hypothetical protein OnM2_009016 [Erysiphe neolycopersici]|uniref:Uncharacterized protein n=1 Tax=Erysiphe neolycopersici TaxID=212602 RepID=A0A420I6R0_9PEZI|nr:hypothetical protein OnM2_009016 [Erysiphe neolycopersici]